ncbi:TPA: hypothetical protein JA361_03465 [Legionella pneumophila]|nr:hypothetical protein [Legionella pneumophila]HAT8183164.1 hypothetical protein [Legionella pneumophila]
MPLTPLFPTNEALKIKQGRTGDCYLLAAIDCIINGNVDGLNHIKKMFEQTEDGVYVKIKRTQLYHDSKNFTPEKLEGKYTHTYDPDSNEDIFFVSNERLQLIDDALDGVSTNSLAVKILERISSYYFTGEFVYYDEADPNASLYAHKQRKNQSLSSTSFVGKLLGVEAEDLQDVNTIIKLKSIIPGQPVYISMEYNQGDKFNQNHSRHALKLDRITCDRLGNYIFVLINPWNNQQEESYSLKQIVSKNPRFCIFNVDKIHHELMGLVCNFSEKIRISSFQYRNLISIFRLIKSSIETLSKNEQSSCLQLCLKLSCTAEEFESLSKEDQQLFSEIIIQSKGFTENLTPLLIKSKRFYYFINNFQGLAENIDFKSNKSFLFDSFLIEKNIQNGNDLIDNLHQLSTRQPSISRALFIESVNNFKEKFGMEFSEFVQRLCVDSPSRYQKLIELAHYPHSRKEFTDSIEQTVHNRQMRFFNSKLVEIKTIGVSLEKEMYQMLEWVRSQSNALKKHNALEISSKTIFLEDKLTETTKKVQQQEYEDLIISQLDAISRSLT